MGGPQEAFTMMFLVLVVTGLGWARASWLRRKLQQRVDMAIANGLPASAITGGPVAERSLQAYDRIDDLEGQMDQVVAQLDRLAESQEFLSRVLTDRLGAPTSLPRRDEEMVTPH